MNNDIKKDFENHWEISDCDSASKQKKKIALKFLEPILDKIRQTQKPISLMDAGCGDGIHALVLAEEITKSNFKYVGFDISRKAINKSKFRLAHDNRFNFKVKDLSEDIKGEKFDIVISYGVIAYAKYPEKLILNISNCLTDQGWLLLWIYSPAYINRFLLRFIRFFSTRCNCIMLNLLCFLLIYLMEFLPISSGVNLSNSTFQQCKETVLVNLRPKILHLPSKKEIEGWINKSHLRKLNDNNIYMRI